MTAPPASPLAAFEQVARLQAASGLLREGRPQEAAAALRVLVAMVPRLAEAQRLLGIALSETGDLAGAEVAFRAALAQDPALARAATGLADVLLSAGRAPEAVEALAPFVNDQTSNFSLLTYMGNALQAAGEAERAVEVLTRAQKMAPPTSAVADHNLAGAQVEVQDFVAAEANALRARAKGLDAAEAWLIQARAVAGQGRLEEAEALYAKAIERRPGYARAVMELANTVWLRGADRAATMAVFERASATLPPNLDLLMQKANLLANSGDPAGAYETLLQALALGDDPEVHMRAAQISVTFDTARALHHASRALALAPENPGHLAALCQVNLAMGRPDIARGLAETLCATLPDDPYSIALLAIVWRMLGDPRYQRLYDYERFVIAQPIDVPDGWPNLGDYLADLRAAIHPLHSFKGHPAGQSARHGSQTQQDLTRSDAPAVRAFFKAIDYPIRRYIAGLGPGSDPLRRRATKAYDFNGTWSIRLQPAGFHVNHLHVKGWLSSACHIELPPAIDTEPEGWLKFGEPGIPTLPHLPPDYMIKPIPGQLVLFPSYMWHGTVPFSGDQPRLTIAFDVIPA